MQRDWLRRVTRTPVGRLAPPTTYIPAVRDFDDAVRRGMGWGMLVESQARDDLRAGRLVELVPGRHTDLPLFWQHWRLESTVMGRLTEAVVEESSRALEPDGS